MTKHGTFEVWIQLFGVAKHHTSVMTFRLHRSQGRSLILTSDCNSPRWKETSEAIIITENILKCEEAISKIFILPTCLNLIHESVYYDSVFLV